MHPEQFSNLRRHFKAIKPLRITVAREVVRGLATAHPEFARWSKKRWTTVDDLNALVRAGVYRIKNFPEFEKLCTRWGKRFASLGVGHDGLIEFRTRWLSHLAAANPDVWTPEAASAWSSFLDAAIGIMARAIMQEQAEAKTRPSKKRARTGNSIGHAVAGAEPIVPASSGTPIFDPAAADARATREASASHQLVIRDATSEDLPGIFEIYDREVLHGTCTFDTQVKTHDERHDWLAQHLSPKYPAIVAVDATRPNHVLGWATLSPWSTRCAYARAAENSVYVRESARGMGVAKALMRELVLAARANRVGVILARVVEGNPLSLKLHERCGFQTIGIMRRVGEKFGQTLDVRLMDLHLDGYARRDA